LMPLTAPLLEHAAEQVCVTSLRSGGWNVAACWDESGTHTGHRANEAIASTAIRHTQSTVRSTVESCLTFELTRGRQMAKPAVALRVQRRVRRRTGTTVMHGKAHCLAVEIGGGAAEKQAWQMSDYRPDCGFAVVCGRWLMQKSLPQTPQCPPSGGTKGSWHRTQ
jgi:hypothetical protein